MWYQLIYLYTEMLASSRNQRCRFLKNIFSFRRLVCRQLATYKNPSFWQGKAMDDQGWYSHLFYTSIIIHAFNLSLYSTITSKGLRYGQTNYWKICYMKVCLLTLVFLVLYDGPVTDLAQAIPFTEGLVGHVPELLRHFARTPSRGIVLN